MPLYEYRCKQCGHQFEKIQTFSAPDETECPVCKGELERLISAPAVQFKGSGFYSTDYGAKPSKGPAKSSESSDSGSSDKATSGDAAGAKSDKSSASPDKGSQSSSSNASGSSTSTSKAD